MNSKKVKSKIIVCERCGFVKEECICEKEMFEEDFEEFGNVLTEEVTKEEVEDDPNCLTKKKEKE